MCEWKSKLKHTLSWRERWLFFFIDTNPFCTAAALELSRHKNDPLLLRNLVEEFKFLIIQELNQQRRLLFRATKNNYALYHVFKLMERNSNADVLLSLLYQGMTDAHALEVMDVIQKHIKKRREERKKAAAHKKKKRTAQQ